jgi:hypothetical protein
LAGALVFKLLALGFGGIMLHLISTSALTEEWNGTSWTETTDLNTGKRKFGRSRNSNISIMQ